MTPIIGGKHDGSVSPAKLVQLTEGEETYIRIKFRTAAGEDHSFYMLSGMEPAEALRIYKERKGIAKGKAHYECARRY